MIHTPEPWHVDAYGCHNDYKLRLCEPMRSGFPLATIAQFQYNWRDAGQYDRQISYKEAEANVRRAVACVNALSGISTEAIEAGGVQELAEALREIRDMKPREYTGPEFDREASDACPDCIKYQGHPIQQGICDEHRRPFYAREDHDKFEERAKGSRCYLIASAALSKWEASK